VLFDPVDFLRPGKRALVRYSGGVFPFGFGKRVECVFEFLFERRAGHRGKVITHCGMSKPTVLRVSVLTP
jgi:hypothetical protein